MTGVARWWSGGGRAPSVDVSPQTSASAPGCTSTAEGAATVENGALFYVDQDDQRWYRSTPESGLARHRAPVVDGPVPLTPVSPADGTSIRYGDGRLTRSGRWLVSVEERVHGVGPTTGWWPSP